MLGIRGRKKSPCTVSERLGTGYPRPLLAVVLATEQYLRACIDAAHVAPGRLTISLISPDHPAGGARSGRYLAVRSTQHPPRGGNPWAGAHCVALWTGGSTRIPAEPLMIFFPRFSPHIFFFFLLLDATTFDGTRQNAARGGKPGVFGGLPTMRQPASRAFGWIFFLITPVAWMVELLGETTDRAGERREAC